MCYTQPLNAQRPAASQRSLVTAPHAHSLIHIPFVSYHHSPVTILITLQCRQTQPLSILRLFDSLTWRIQIPIVMEEKTSNIRIQVTAISTLTTGEGLTTTLTYPGQTTFTSQRSTTITVPSSLLCGKRVWGKWVADLIQESFYQLASEMFPLVPFSLYNLIFVQSSRSVRDRYGQDNLCTKAYLFM